MARQGYGAGSMSQRQPGVWRLRVMVDGRQVERTFRGTEAAARRALRQLDTTATIDDDGRTFGDLLDKWLAFQRSRGRAPKTLAENMREIETRIRPQLGAIPLTRLTAEDLDAAYTAWQREGLSDSSVHRHHAVISSALSQGVKWRWLPSNPAKGQATPPAAKSNRKLVTPTPEMVAKLVRAAEDTDPVMAAAVALGFVTGARRGELCALKWSDIDLESGAVRIDKSLTQVSGEVTVKTTKTGRGRTFSIDARTVALLRAHRAWQERLAAVAGSPRVADPYVLSDNANGARPVEPSKITDRFTKLRGRARVRGVRFQDLRHAAATLQLAAGIPVHSVSSRLGHASTRMTLDRYGHALPAGDQAGAAVMGALLPG